MSSTFTSLHYRNYRLWFAGALVANVGTWMQRVAQDWLVLTQLTDNSGVALGVTTALQFGPTLLLSAWAGLLADRVNRRRLLMATQAAQGVLAAVLGALVLAGHAQLWHVYLLAGLLGCVGAVDAPVRQTFVAELVPAPILANAVGLNSVSFNAARLVGPGLAGIAIAAVGTGGVFVLNALTFAATIAALLAMRVGELNLLPSAPRARGQIREGLAYVRRRGDLVMVMAVVGLVSTFTLNFQVTGALMTRVEFGRDAAQYGVLGSVLAVGSLTGALMAARRRRPRSRLVVGSAFALGLASGLSALMPTFWTFALASIPVGFASLTMLTAANSVVQLGTEPTMRGRVMAIYMMVLMGATPIGAPIVGWIGEGVGPRWAIGLGALTALAASLAATAWARRRWNVEVHYARLPRPHLEVLYPPVAGRAEAADALAAQDAVNARTAA